MKMVQSDPLGGGKALDQARRRRVVKPPDQRRREILEAAAELFAQLGYDVATVKAIATRAGVAAGTVYLYFPSKDAMLHALKEDFEAGLLERVAAIATAVLAEEDATGEIVGYQEVVERLIDGMVAYSLENKADTDVLARHVGRAATIAEALPLQSSLNEVLSGVIREGIRLGYVNTSDPEMTAYLLNLAAATAVGSAIAFHDDEMLERVVAQTKELYIKALAPDLGASTLKRTTNAG
jgi:AcrR family transcriptional regulator